MTDERWRLVGGYVVALFNISMVNILFDWQINWLTVGVGIAAATVGHGIGRFGVREWQEARR